MSPFPLISQDLLPLGPSCSYQHRHHTHTHTHPHTHTHTPRNSSFFNTNLFFFLFFLPCCCAFWSLFCVFSLTKARVTNSFSSSRSSVELSSLSSAPSSLSEVRHCSIFLALEEALGKHQSSLGSSWPSYLHIGPPRLSTGPCGRRPCPSVRNLINRRRARRG